MEYGLSVSFDVCLYDMCMSHLVFSKSQTTMLRTCPNMTVGVEWDVKPQISYSVNHSSFTSDLVTFDYIQTLNVWYFSKFIYNVCMFACG